MMKNKHLIKILAQEIQIKFSMMEELNSDSKFVDNVSYSGLALIKVLLEEMEKE
jgi:hypothetical protein